MEKTTIEPTLITEPTPKTWSVGTLTYTQAGLIGVFVWLLWGDFAWAMRDRTVPSILTLLLHKYKASDTLMSVLMMSLPLVISFFFAPVVAFKSDRHRGSRGRRIPFLMVGVPIAFLTINGLAFTPKLGELLHNALGKFSPGLNPTVLTLFTIFWGISACATILVNNVYLALVNDVVPQEIMGRFIAFFRATSLIVAMVLNYYVLPKTKEFYLPIMVGMSLIYGVGLMLMCFKVKEGEYPPPETMPGKKNRWATLGSYFKTCFGNPFYLLYFAATSLAALSMTLPGGFNIYFYQSINMSDEQYFHCIAISFAISLLITYPLGWMTDRFHPLRLVIPTIGLIVGVFFWGALFAKEASTFAVLLIISTVVSGIYWTTSGTLGQKLLPNAKFAELSSGGSIIAAILGMVSPPLMGQFIEKTGHVYRYAYFIGCGMALISLVMLLLLYRSFMKLGGPENYVAP